MWGLVCSIFQTQTPLPQTVFFFMNHTVYSKAHTSPFLSPDWGKPSTRVISLLSAGFQGDECFFFFSFFILNLKPTLHPWELPCPWLKRRKGRPCLGQYGLNKKPFMGGKGNTAVCRAGVYKCPSARAQCCSALSAVSSPLDSVTSQSAAAPKWTFFWISGTGPKPGSHSRFNCFLSHNTSVFILTINLTLTALFKLFCSVLILNTSQFSSGSYLGRMYCTDLRQYKEVQMSSTWNWRMYVSSLLFCVDIVWPYCFILSPSQFHNSNSLGETTRDISLNLWRSNVTLEQTNRTDDL